jgi:hypothetical protein
VFENNFTGERVEGRVRQEKWDKTIHFNNFRCIRNKFDSQVNEQARYFYNFAGSENKFSHLTIYIYIYSCKKRSLSLPMIYKFSKFNLPKLYPQRSNLSLIENYFARSYTQLSNLSSIENKQH